MEDIFAKLDLIEKLVACKAVQEIWVQLSSNEYQNKVTNKKLSRIDFLRYQERVGSAQFIVEVLR